MCAMAAVCVWRRCQLPNPPRAPREVLVADGADLASIAGLPAASIAPEVEAPRERHDAETGTGILPTLIITDSPHGTPHPARRPPAGYPTPPCRSAAAVAAATLPPLGRFCAGDWDAARGYPLFLFRAAPLRVCHGHRASRKRRCTLPSEGGERWRRPGWRRNQTVGQNKRFGRVSLARDEICSQCQVKVGRKANQIHVQWIKQAIDCTNTGPAGGGGGRPCTRVAPPDVVWRRSVASTCLG